MARRPLPARRSNWSRTARSAGPAVGTAPGTTVTLGRQPGEGQPATEPPPAPAPKTTTSKTPTTSSSTPPGTSTS